MKLKVLELVVNMLLNIFSNPVPSIELHSFSHVSRRYLTSKMYLQYIQSSRHIHVSMVTNKSHFISNKSNAKRIKLKLNSTMQIDWFIIDRWIVFISLSYFKLKCTDIFQNTWIDASTLFYWLKNEHKIHKPYVQRRLVKD